MIRVGKFLNGKNLQQIEENMSKEIVSLLSQIAPILLKSHEVKKREFLQENKLNDSLCSKKSKSNVEILNQNEVLDISMHIFECEFHEQSSRSNR